MAINKYVGDYRIVEDVDRRGRLRSRTEYRGPHFYYTDTDGTGRGKGERGQMPRGQTAPGAEEGLRSGRRRSPRGRWALLGGVLALWALWIGAMMPVSESLRLFWVSLPFVACAVPLFLLSEGVLGLFVWKEPLERRQADRIRERNPQCALILCVLALLSLPGGIAAAVAAEQKTGDIVFLVCAALLALTAALETRLAGRVGVEERERPMHPAEKNATAVPGSAGTPPEPPEG